MGANLLPVPGRTLRRSRRIDRVNQLTQAAKSAANRRENQPAQVDSFEFIVFFLAQLAGQFRPHAGCP